MFWSKTKKITERCMTEDGRYLFSGNHNDSFIGLCEILDWDKNQYSSFKDWLNRYDFPEDFPWHQHWAEWVACMFKGCIAPSKYAVAERPDWSTDEPRIDLKEYDSLLNSDLDDLWQRAFDDVDTRATLFDFVGFIMRNQDEDDPYAVGVLVDPYDEYVSSQDSVEAVLSSVDPEIIMKAMTAILEEEKSSEIQGERTEKEENSGANTASPGDTADLKIELAKAKDLLDQELIDESEFKDLKRKILGL